MSKDYYQEGNQFVPMQGPFRAFPRQMERSRFGMEDFRKASMPTNQMFRPNPFTRNHMMEPRPQYPPMMPTGDNYGSYDHEEAQGSTVYPEDLRPRMSMEPRRMPQLRQPHEMQQQAWNPMHARQQYMQPVNQMGARMQPPMQRMGPPQPKMQEIRRPMQHQPMPMQHSYDNPQHMMERGLGPPLQNRFVPIPGRMPVNNNRPPMMNNFSPPMQGGNMRYPEMMRPMHNNYPMQQNMGHPGEAMMGGFDRMPLMPPWMGDPIMPHFGYNTHPAMMNMPQPKEQTINKTDQRYSLKECELKILEEEDFEDITTADRQEDISDYRDLNDADLVSLESSDDLGEIGELINKKRKISADFDKSVSFGKNEQIEVSIYEGNMMNSKHVVLYTRKQEEVKPEISRKCVLGLVEIFAATCMETQTPPAPPTHPMMQRPNEHYAQQFNAEWQQRNHQQCLNASNERLENKDDLVIYKYITREGVDQLRCFLEYRLRMVLYELKARRKKILNKSLEDKFSRVDVEEVLFMLRGEGANSLSAIGQSAVTAVKPILPYMSSDSVPALIDLKKYFNKPTSPCPTLPYLKIHWLAINGLFVQSHENTEGESSSLTTKPRLTYFPAVKRKQDQYQNIEIRSVPNVEVQKIEIYLSKEHKIYLQHLKSAIFSHNNDKHIFDISKKIVLYILVLQKIRDEPISAQLVPYFAYFVVIEMNQTLKTKEQSLVMTLLRFIDALASNTHVILVNYAAQIIQPLLSVILSPYLNSEKHKEENKTMEEIIVDEESINDTFLDDLDNIFQNEVAKEEKKDNQDVVYCNDTVEINGNIRIRRYAAAVLAKVISKISSVTVIYEKTVSVFYEVLKNVETTALSSMIGAVIALRALGGYSVRNVLFPLLSLLVEQIEEVEKKELLEMQTSSFKLTEEITERFTLRTCLSLEIQGAINDAMKLHCVEIFGLTYLYPELDNRRVLDILFNFCSMQEKRLPLLVNCLKNKYKQNFESTNQFMLQL